MTEKGKMPILRFLITVASVLLVPTSSSKPAAAANSPKKLFKELKQLPYRIVCESFHQGNWELFMIKADGSNAVNLTQTPNIDELYPHVSPDGTKVCFLVDSGQRDAKVRSVYCMDLDGNHRTLVAHNAR